MIGGFLAVVFGIPLGQAAVEWAHGERPRVLDLVYREAFPSKHDLKQFEDTLHDDALAKQFVQPCVQEQISGPLGFGNAQVIVGRDGWLFYRPGVDYVTGPGFLEPWRLHQRSRYFKDATAASSIQPDPRRAILAFRDQCAAAGAELVLLPIPDKAMLQPWQLSSRVEADAEMPTPNNPSYEGMVQELRAAGVEVLDLVPDHIEPGEPHFLKQDTHWTPQWLDDLASRLADRLRPWIGNISVYQLRTKNIEVSRVGDLVDMLRLPAGQKLFPSQTVTIQPVLDASGQIIRPDPAAPVLLLGDSFTNIYSAEPMGWGSGAGLAERLSWHLGRPIDWLARNDAGAYATRQILAEEMARGRDRLAGKKVIVWQFAMRELAVGDWKLIAIDSKPPAPVPTSASPARFLTLEPGASRRITGVVRQVAPGPLPGTVPYKDHIVAIAVTDLRDEHGPLRVANAAVVYTWSMRNNVRAEAARWQTGQTVTLLLRPWADVEPKLGSINRRDLADESLLLVEPCWVERIGD
jgi:alginate O-acetyltransferase complex protein AlgJ